jgi:FkbM family methyltransferase
MRSPSTSQDPLTFDQIKKMVGRDDPVILDVGSNDGSHTNKFLETFPGASVYSFEPDPRAIAKWKRNVTERRATLYEGALAAVSGETTFHVSSGQRPGMEGHPNSESGWDESGSLRAPKTHLKVWPWVKFREKISIKAMAMDEWATDHNIDRVDFIWADVQGAEGDLIEGGLQTLKRTRYFYSEFSDDEWYEGQITLDTMTTLLADDFEMAALWSMDVLFRNKHLTEPHPLACS